MRRHSDRINKIVIHHSASKRSTTVDNINLWHVVENGWQDIGYHYVITGLGIVNHCRPIHFIGAHTGGFNDRSIGICLVGDNTKPGQEWSREQVSALHNLVRSLCVVFDFPEIFGHRDLKNGTLCPGVDVRPMFYGPNNEETRK